MKGIPPLSRTTEHGASRDEATKSRLERELQEARQQPQNMTKERDFYRSHFRGRVTIPQISLQPSSSTAAAQAASPGTAYGSWSVSSKECR